MVCERKFHSEFKEIDFPNWDPADIDSSLSTVKRILQEESTHGGFYSTFERLKDKGRFKLWKSSFDFNSDGSENVVYRITSIIHKEQCRDRNNNQGLASNAIQIRYLVEQNQINDLQSGFWNVNGEILGDVFLFQKQPYFHSWQEDASIQSDSAKSYEWPFPRIVVRKGVSQFSHRESFYDKPVCEIGYRE